MNTEYEESLARIAAGGVTVIRVDEEYGSAEVIATPCVEWTKYRDQCGYGKQTIAGKTHSAHRVVWERARGPIPAGLEVDHLCFNPACINVEHLALTDRSSNARRQRSALKTHCLRGHLFDESNILYQKGRYGPTRSCRACHNARNRAAYWAKRKA